MELHYSLQSTTIQCMYYNYHMELLCDIFVIINDILPFVNTYARHCIVHTVILKCCDNENLPSYLHDFVPSYCFVILQ